MSTQKLRDMRCNLLDAYVQLDLCIRKGLNTIGDLSNARAIMQETVRTICGAIDTLDDVLNKKPANDDGLLRAQHKAQYVGQHLKALADGHAGDKFIQSVFNQDADDIQFIHQILTETINNQGETL